MKKVNIDIFKEVFVNFILFYKIRILLVFLFFNPFAVLFLKAQMPVSDYADSLFKKNNYFGLKTNLLYDAALLPNLSVEFPFGKDRNWSLVLEGNWSWWTFDDPPRSYHRIQAAGLELRRWFASPAPLLGHAVGIYALGGTYDLRLWPKSNDSRGRLSYWSYSCGLSYAWSIPIGRRFHLELGLAAGYMGGRYCDYKFHINDDHERWEWITIRNRNYVGVTRTEISLVWIIGRNDKQLKKGGLQ